MAKFERSSVIYVNIIQRANPDDICQNDYYDTGYAKK